MFILDYKEVESLMNRLDEERMTLIKSKIPYLRSFTKKLSKAGLTEIIDRASSTTHQGRDIIGDRQFVKSLVQKFKVKAVDFHGSILATPVNIRMRINELVKRLETNAIVLAVDVDRYWPVVYDGRHLKPYEFPRNSQHVVILAGYEISDDTFFIRDSNFKKVIAVKAKDIVLSTEWAGFYTF